MNLMHLSRHRWQFALTFPTDVRLPKEELADAVNPSRTVPGEILQGPAR
jgi:hypothetical protein